MYYSTKMIKLNAMKITKDILLGEGINERGKITLSTQTKTSFLVRKCIPRKKGKQINLT